MGLVGGVLLVMSWWRCGSILCCVGVVGLLLGFLLAASVFFTPAGEVLGSCRGLQTFHVTTKLLRSAGT